MRQPDDISVAGNSCSRPGPERTVSAFPLDSASKTKRGFPIGVEPNDRGHS